MKRLLVIAIATLLAMSLAVPAFSAGGTEKASQQVIMYGTFTPELLQDWAQMYQAETGRTLEYIRLSAGELAARVQAEGARPGADVVQGLQELFLSGMLERGSLRAIATPANARHYPADIHHPEGYWWGFMGTAGTMLVNKERFARLYPDHELPQTWEDFVRPEYRGEWIMPNPTSSGTGFAWLIAQVMRSGTENWDFLERVASMQPILTASGIAPSQQVAIGEFTFAVSDVSYDAIHLGEGHPVVGIVPGPTNGDVLGMAALNNGPNGPEAAEHFINWLLGKSAQQQMNDIMKVASLHSDVDLGEGFPDMAQIEFVRPSPEFSSSNRERILRIWEDLLDRY